jgi:hypothetical protein
MEESAKNGIVAKLKKDSFVSLSLKHPFFSESKH